MHQKFWRTALICSFKLKYHCNYRSMELFLCERYLIQLLVIQLPEFRNSASSILVWGNIIITAYSLYESTLCYVLNYSNRLFLLVPSVSSSQRLLCLSLQSIAILECFLKSLSTNFNHVNLGFPRVDFKFLQTSSKQSFVCFI